MSNFLNISMPVPNIDWNILNFKKKGIYLKFKFSWLPQDIATIFLPNVHSQLMMKSRNLLVKYLSIWNLSTFFYLS